MQGFDGWFLMYRDDEDSISFCWAVSPTREGAEAEIEGLLKQHPEVVGVLIEEWRGGRLLSVTPMPVRKEN
jgi:hypothetical protein